MMERVRWEQIERLYHAALERGPDAREAFLDEACVGDEDLRREVAGLLACDIPSDSFIRSPAIEIAARAMAGEPHIETSNNTMRSLIAESQIGAYQLLSPLGRGGMGEVYLALDTRLGRKVAVKLLLAEFTTDAERLRRFEQEARAASALNHPNIITIHEIGEFRTEAGDTHYIVTEYVEGETLRQRLTSAPQIGLKLSETIGLAAQIAAALAAAHGAGIIHRDIKPENVMVRRDGIVKVLDFGLAKLTEPSSHAVNTQAATIARNRTDMGVVMGTPRYMAPEQARGEKVDARTDIFSLGVVLYEMIAGRAPFTGATASDCIAAILKEEPPELSETNQKVTPQLEKIVRRCLEKNPERRFQSASDLGFALEALSTPSGSRQVSQMDSRAAPAVMENVGASSVRKHERLAWLSTVAILLVTLGFVCAYFTRQPLTNNARAMRFSILPPEKSSFSQIALSPDGRHLAFTAATGGNLQLWVRALDATEARALAGTQGARFPFWSPDGRFIGFFADGRLKKIDVTGGPVQTLREVGLALGAAWSHDGVILYGVAGFGLFRIAATGGEVAQVTTYDRSRQESSHHHPTFLPDGRHFLYTIQSGQKETRGVYIGSLEDNNLKQRLLDDYTVVKYMAAVPGATVGGDGWLVFGRDGALVARRFDTSRLDFTGEQFSLSDKVGSDVNSSSNSIFSISDNGVLVFDPSLNRQRRQYRWVDRRGQPINSLDVAAGLYSPWLSSDEKCFIADHFDSQTSTYDLWLCDVSGGNPQRFTFDPANDFCPVWSADGSRIIWASNRGGGVANLYQKAASLAGEETLLLKPDYNKIPTDWSRDMRLIIYYVVDPKTNADVWVLPAPGSGEAAPFPAVRTEANEIAGTLSPDGQWLAYASDVSGRYEVYAQSFPDGGGKRQVSTGGGIGPHWRRDGRELFYYAGDGKLMAAPVRRGENLEVGESASLFEFRAGTLLVTFTPYAVTADGQRFLINAVVDKEPSAPLTVVTNWTTDLK
jgi:serine/threonine protein kinase/Tol biopolymer transport system component